MDIAKLMQSYAAVVKLGSFTQAADELGATRALISKRIKELESTLGVKLLNRNTHGLSVTAAGADYYEGCVSLLARMRSLNERMQDKRTALTGEIRLFASKTFSETVLAPIIAEFCAMHPEVSIRIALINRDAESYGMHLVSGGYDMAVLSVPIEDSSLIARPIGRVTQVLVAAPRYLESHGAPRKPSDLSAHNCLDPGGALFSTWELNGPNGRMSVRVTGRIRTNGTFIVRHAALEGLGIAILREYLVAKHLQDGSLVRVLGNYSMNERTIHIVFQKDAYQPRRMKVFADYLARRVAEMVAPAPASFARGRHAMTKAAIRRTAGRSP
jgi:DNA-binding transcriptional LysR family regulator